jgi:hypothetical protein
VIDAQKQRMRQCVSTNFGKLPVESPNLSETPENPVASERGCRGGEMLIPSATRCDSEAGRRWRMDEGSGRRPDREQIPCSIPC